MIAEKLDNLTKRFASEVAEFENKHKVINGGFVTGLFRKYLIEAEKEAWNAAIDAAAQGAEMQLPNGNTCKTISSITVNDEEFDFKLSISKQSILNLKK